MKEARIECLVRDFSVRDLDLHGLRQGDIAFVEEARARASRDLADALQLRVVRVRYVQRARMTRNPPRSPPPPSVRLAKRRPPSAAQSGEVPNLADAIQRAAEEAAHKATQGVMAELRQLLLSAASVAAGTPAAGIAVTGEELVAEPVFIPNQIVNKEADIKVASTSTEAEGLDAAAEALKTTRRSRKKE